MAINTVAFWRVALFACAAAVLGFATLPLDQPLPSTGWDKSDHLLAFVVLGLLGLRAYPAAQIRCQLGLFGFGVGIELLQGLLPYRSGEWRDVVADGGGLVIVQVLSRLGVTGGKA